jgi:hypothetical protein
MTNTNSVCWFTLLQKEFREYKNSFFWTPVIMAIGLTVLMLLSVLLVGRVSVVGTAIHNALINEGNMDAMNITLHIEPGEGTELTMEERSIPIQQQDEDGVVVIF